MAEGQKKKAFDASIKRVLRDYAEALLFAVIIAIILRIFFISSYKIPTSSMTPTLRVGDFIIAYKWPFGFHVPFSSEPNLGFQMPHRGDVIVFVCPDSPSSRCIKRVVGLPGDRVQIVKKNLFINNRKAEYARAPDQDLSDFEVTKPYAIVYEKIDGRKYKITIQNKRGLEDYGPIVVPPDHVFVLADSRDSSKDSRLWGPIPTQYLTGRAQRIWLSLDWSKTWKEGGLPSVRWSRFFRRIE